MRVEVRRRSEFSRHGAGPSNPTIVEAYSDNCFETQTRFYTVAPDHPKLGKWSQPSTLKYGQQHPSDMSSHQSLNENAHPTAIRISSTRRSRPTCSSPPVVAHGLVGRSGTTTPTMMAASNGSICRSSRVRQRVQSRRTTRPVSPLCARSESPPPSTARGRQGEAPRIDTPISGRVSVVHFCSMILALRSESRIKWSRVRPLAFVLHSSVKITIISSSHDDTNISAHTYMSSTPQ